MNLLGWGLCGWAGYIGMVGSTPLERNNAITKRSKAITTSSFFASFVVTLHFMAANGAGHSYIIHPQMLVMRASPEQQHLVVKAAPTVSPDDNPSSTMTMIVVSLYLLSGCIQPILMTLLRQAGLADPSCQLYMMFYYFGTASATFLVQGNWPSKTTILKASGIALWDVAAQSMNYTGAALAGPTIFAIIYSSVTIWAALYSQLLLERKMDASQWMAVLIVFGGLALTAADSMELGPGVVRGLFLVILGSSMHGLFYVLSEAVMTKGEERLTVEQNCAIQGLTASAIFGMWQLIYTIPHWEIQLRKPMETAGTTALMGLGLLIIFGFVSFVHSITFYHTLRHLPGGSTSAGVFKALQAVLVLVLTHIIYCGRVGGAEMCFSTVKFLSLATVAGGVLLYGYATSKSGNNAALKNRAGKDAGGSYDSIDKEKEKAHMTEEIAPGPV